MGAVAVIGMACRLPGAPTCEQFWTNLTEKKDCIREIPPDRWDTNRYYSPDPSQDGTSNSKWAGLLDQVDKFDHQLFGVSSREARSMDPQQRLLLEEAWHCLEDAGIPHERLREKVTAVYVGAMTIDYHQNVTSPFVVPDSYSCLGNYVGILANRMSNVFGWRGESYTLDAACAGSLTALHQARRALLLGECDYAVVAGVSLIINPWHYVSFGKSRMLSATGTCRTFDRDANGYVPGEGVSVMLLCREDLARQRGYRMHGKILGTATGHVGASDSITAPSVAAQRRVIEDAAAAAGVGLDTVSYIEAHGTGTPLGDPIEVAALTEALTHGAKRTDPCLIGSVKTSIGHLEAAAGLAGVAKVLLMMRHRTIVPTLNLAHTNPLIDFETGPLRPVSETTPWTAPIMRAGISGFGFGGTNAHAIIEAVEPPDDMVSHDEVALPFVLSARSPASFRALWLAWRDFVASPAFAAMSLRDAIGTLALGREALPYRWAAAVTDKEALRRVFSGTPPEPTKSDGAPTVLAQCDRADPAAMERVTLMRRLGIHVVAVEYTGSPAATSADLPVFDRENGQVRLRWALDATYLGTLRDALEAPSGADFDRLVLRSHELVGTNFTFRTYLTDWQRALGPHGDLLAWLETPPTDTRGRRLLLLGLSAAHRRLRRRWQLPDHSGFTSEAADELSALIVDGLLQEDEAVALLTGAASEAARIAVLAAGRALVARLPIDYPILARHSAERAGIVAMTTPPGNLTIAVGGHRILGLLAELWQSGAAIAWAGLDASRRVVSLPLYPFDGSRHWIDLQPDLPIPAAVTPAQPAQAPVAPSALPGFDQLDAYTAQQLFTALTRAGAITELGVGIPRSSIAQRCLRLPKHHALLDACIDMLGRHGLVSLDRDHVRALTNRKDAAATAASLRRSIDTVPDLGAIADIVERCVGALPDVLAGEVPAEDILFPGGQTETIERLLMEHQDARDALAATASAVRAAVTDRLNRSPAQRVRILEVGAGTGIATVEMLAAFASFSDRIDYVCTDRSTSLLSDARRRLSGRYDWATFTQLDLTTPSTASDGLGQFDIVLAVNALHAVCPIDRALAHLKGRLRNGGSLIIHELTQAHDVFTVTLGLLADWWRGDPARTEPGALLSTGQWQTVLQTRFVAVEASRSGLHSHIVAQTPSDHPAIVPEDRTLLDLIRTVIAATIEADVAIVTDDVRLVDIGVDSLAAHDVTRRLADALHIAIAPHVIDDHPTPGRLARYLATSATPEEAPMPPPTSEPRVAPDGSDALLDVIRRVVAAVAEIQPNVIDDTVRFVDLGVDSILAGDAATLLSTQLGRPVSMTAFNDHPTPVRLARYLAAAIPDVPKVVQPIAPDTSAWGETDHWVVSEPGSLDTFLKCAATRRPPGPDEVEVETVAIGLNFRDVMEALGRIGADPRPLGLEFAGRISALGPQVVGLSVGQAVVGIAIGSLKRHVVTRASLVAPKPPRLTFAEAASLPIVFLTAVWTMETLARLGDGQKVLVHAATGGVGLAAQQVIAGAGATMLGTAGSPRKREHLQKLGLTCVSDSRSVAFVEAVRDATGGAGVDVVLNCLAGPMTDAGLRLVRPGGIFIEIGKTDIRTPEEVARLNPRIRYTVFDLLGEIDRNPDLVGRKLNTLMDRFASDELTAPPVSPFRFDDAPTALRYLSRARHIGKVVLTDEAERLALPPPRPAGGAIAKPVLASMPDPIAIIGMAGRFPGAPDVGAFWRLLRDGIDAVSEVPDGRWTAREFVACGAQGSGEPRHRAGGFIADAESFDAAFFGISPREALLMDPQQRVLLEQAWLALTDAGVAADEPNGRRTGVFIGASASDYGLKAALAGIAPDRPSLVAQMPSSLAARLGYAFDLKGPCLTVDTGCASAVAALKLAVDALRTGEVDMAIAGAVAIQSTPQLALMADQAAILSPDGRCHSFAADGQGLTLSEGVGVVVLKRLSDAIANGDAVHAVIRAVAVSQNGATNGMNVPSVSAQVEVARSAFANAGIAPETVSYIEGHGVGTRAGDTAEIAALTEVFGHQHSVALGSAKSNIGHTLAAAGMAGLFKVVLQLRHETLVPSLHVGSGVLSDLSATALSVNTDLTTWRAADGQPRRAAINAFAINGGNGFILVEEAPSTPHRSINIKTQPTLFLVAARDEAALRLRLRDLAEWLRDAIEPFADIAAALRSTAPDLEWRAAFVAADTDSLRDQLLAAANDAPISGACLGMARPGDLETRPIFASLAVQLCADAAMATGAGIRAKLLAAARLFVDGANFVVPADPAARPARSLPLHRFNRQRYWLGDTITTTVPATPILSEDKRLPTLRAAAATVLRLPADQLSSQSVLQRVGLDSLLAFELRDAVKRLMGSAPEPSVFLSGRTLEDIAALLPTHTAEGSAEPVLANPEQRFEPFPLTDIQMSYWLGRTSKFALGGACHVYWEFVGKPDRDPDRLEDALNRLIVMHDMLRAVIGEDGLQRVLPSVGRYGIDRHDWRDRNDRGEALDALRTEMARERFNPEHWPLFHVAYSQDHLCSRIHLSIDLLIIDVPSLALLLKQWSALEREPASIIATPAIGYRDYVVHQKQQESSVAYHAAHVYWSKLAPTLPPAPNLPEMKPLDARPDWAWRRHHARLDANTWQALQSHARLTGVTPVVALVSAFGEVIARWATSPRFTLNLTVNDRERIHSDICSVIGDFTSTVLLGFDGSQPLGFGARALAVGNDLANHLGHARFSGVKVLQLRGAGSAPTLMPVVFTSMLGYGALSGSLGRLDFGATQTPQVWLDVQVMEDDGALVVTWDAIDALFPDGLLAAMFAAWVAALTALARHSDLWQQPLRAWLDTAERGRRVRRNATDYPVVEGLLHEPFLQQALENPDRVAVIAPDATLTYSQLLSHAAAISQSLGAIEPNRLVAVVLPKGWQQIAAVIGILMSGGAYLPIDPALPEARQHHLLVRGAVATVLTSSETTTSWPSNLHVIAVDRLSPVPAFREMPIRQATPRDLAYVIFTSGSTGEPKGVMIEHRSALNTVIDVNDRFSVTSNDRVLGLSALGFDLSVYDIFGVLGAGGALVLPAQKSVGDPAYLARLVLDHEVTIWNSVPMFMQLFVAGEQSIDAMRQLRLVMMSGDWIPIGLPPRLHQANPALDVVSLGGATEASIWSIAYTVGPLDPTWASVPYGFPMRNQTFHVLDEHMADCLDGMSGELYIGGVGLARGYWRDRDTTEARFVHHPVTGERLYRTGDHGRYRDDGVIEFLGRVDGQVKLGGYRIELGEIEAALARHPDIRQAAVVVHGDRADRKSLAAFFVCDATSPPDAAALRAYLGASLPAYMIPATFELLAALPLNANEKVDRKALGTWQKPNGAAFKEIRLPQPITVPAVRIAELEERILAIWRDVLSNPTLPADGKLFEHGAHSFHAVDANARINRALQIGCTVTDIFEFATVKALAEALGGRASPRPEASDVPPTPVNGHVVSERQSRGQRRLQFRSSPSV